MTLGVIIGKFKPFTNGHEYLINTASSQVNNLIVIIAGKDDDIPHPEYRLKWMKYIYNNMYSQNNVLNVFLLKLY